jgi:hypothetical protein
MEDRKDIREERGWVIVTKDTVLEYDTFMEAIEVNKNYFENHYKNE